ncbi:MAG: ThuA domain-containing protein [Verrucomicrobiae bacterium]|nr:ThuA domain-containing protein [Verrucomicrobiae bacterium]
MKKIIVGLAMLGLLAGVGSQAAEKKIVFIAGTPSHGPGEHEHRAGCLLFQTCLQNTPGITSVVYSNGWPADPKAFENAATIVVYADGGGGHPLLQGDHLKIIGALMDQGVGLVCLHYATEPTLEKGEREFLEWIGGAFEINWSVNPHWDAHFKSLPEHPVARGVKPFHIVDEWYFNLRFRDQMQGVTPLLSAVPDGSTTNRNDGPHEGNPAMRAKVARGEIQHVAWAAERPGGGRGFGLTGGHFHKNWGNDDMRKLVLNAILWTAHVDVPADGFQSRVTPDQLAANLDYKGPRRPPAQPRAPGAPAPARR